VPRCAVLGDGSPWIWNTATELFPQAIQILDRFHVKEALHRTAQSIFGAASPEAKPWATARCTELDDGKLQAIIRALRPHISSTDEAAKCVIYIFRVPRDLESLLVFIGCKQAGHLVVSQVHAIRPLINQHGLGRQQMQLAFENEERKETR